MFTGEEIMKKLFKLFLVSLVLVANIGVAKAEESGFLAAENFSATLTFTTDYTFRGTTFSHNKPAIQGSFDWAYGSWFAGAWATSLDPQDDDALGGTMEIDYYFGWGDTVAGIDVVIFPLVYTFPGQYGDGARNDTTFELWTSFGRGFENVNFSPYINLEFNWSPKYFGGGESSFYIRPSIALSLPRGFGLDFGYAYQDVGGAGGGASGNGSGNELFEDNYSHIDVGITNSFKGFDLDVRYHDNLDDDIIVVYGIDSQVEFSISRSF